LLKLIIFLVGLIQEPIRIPISLQLFLLNLQLDSQPASLLLIKVLMFLHLLFHHLQKLIEQLIRQDAIFSHWGREPRNFIWFYPRRGMCGQPLFWEFLKKRRIQHKRFVKRGFYLRQVLKLYLFLFLALFLLEIRLHLVKQIHTLVCYNYSVHFFIIINRKFIKIINKNVLKIKTNPIYKSLSYIYKS